MIDPQTNNTLDGVAIIGMAGRFPGAANVDDLWRNLCEGVESITFFTDKELDPSIAPVIKNHPSYVKARGILEDADRFDAAFFGIYPREAEIMDPQHRIFLEVAWEALENAGYDPDSFNGLIGVFGGAGINTYFPNIVSAHPEKIEAFGEHQTSIANGPDYLATRVSYKLNLRGPSVSLYTGCSTSLVAVCYGFDSLMSYQSDMVLAGGIFIQCPQNSGYLYQEGEIFSADGHCRPFDSRAQGTVFSNGVGIVVLKRLADAYQDGNFIYGIIRGVAVNNDGSKKMSFLAPSVDGQAEVIAMALANADVNPETISYIETHGTATPVGDPIEIAALTQAFRPKTLTKHFCPIGSIKGNLGHLDAAAGIAGLIKTALMLHYKVLPPSLNFKDPNPKIDFANSPFYMNSRLSPWETGPGPRRAGVSSFGVGGTNSHVVLEEAPVKEDSGPSRPWKLLLLSAKTTTALDKATTNLIKHLKQHPHLKLEDAAYTLQIGRRAFNHRRMVVCKNLDDALASLETLDSRRVLTSIQVPMNLDVVFMFSGQGAQYVNMGLELYGTEPEFREQIDRCSEMLLPHLAFDLRDVLYPGGGNVEEAAQKLEKTFITQPALFTIEYALAKLWMSWGVNPAALVGHSIGEYVAACLAGVFSLEDALSLIAARGRLMQGLPEGSMLAVSLSEREVQPFLDPGLSLSAINSPSFCVVSGEKEAIERLKEELSKKSLDYRVLHTSHAFHSKMMEPILESFTEKVKQVRLNPPQIPFVSNFTGTWITPDEAMDPSYWARHLRQTIRFSNCVQELLKEPNRVFLEVGPGQTLATFVRQHSDGSKGRIVLSSTRHPKDRESDGALILNTLGRVWLAGIHVDWGEFYKSERRHRVPLPTYPFKRQRFWLEPVVQPRGDFASQAGSGKTENNHQGSTELGLGDIPVFEDLGLKSNYVAPRNEVENIIAKIWTQMLGIDQVGIHDNFIELGGDSLLATRVIVRIREMLRVDFPLERFFEAPTIIDLSMGIEEILIKEIEELPEDVAQRRVESLE